MGIKLNKKLCLDCETLQYIFSKGRCKQCASKSYDPIPKQTEQNKNKRKTDRAGFGDFFVKHIQIIKDGNLSCQECGKRIVEPNASNVAHVLGKGMHLEVATNDLNVLYLCGLMRGEQCHSKFDSSMANRQSMNVFALAFERYQQIKHLVIKESSETRLFDQYEEK